MVLVFFFVSVCMGCCFFHSFQTLVNRLVGWLDGWLDGWLVFYFFVPVISYKTFNAHVIICMHMWTYYCSVVYVCIGTVFVITYVHQRWQTKYKTKKLLHTHTHAHAIIVVQNTNNKIEFFEQRSILLPSQRTYTQSNNMNLFSIRYSQLTNCL